MARNNCGCEEELISLKWQRNNHKEVIKDKIIFQSQNIYIS